MELKSEFSKMQCLFTGNRFSGFNIAKDKFQFDFTRGPADSITLTLNFLSEISYLEVEDEVKYQQWATVTISKKQFINFSFLKEITVKIYKELKRRYDNSNIVKFLEIKEFHEFDQSQIDELLQKALSDYENGVS